MENDPPDIVFPYTEGEFFSLQQANIAASSISLVASICVVLTYIYMLVYHGKKANRVSLRCVFLCSVSEALSSIMSIVVTTDKVYFCNAANIVIGFTSIFSSAALTIVGINLILIFVINVKRRDVLERFYYPILVIYSIVGALAPIYRHIGVNSTNTGDHSCWYITYILVRSKSNFPYVSMTEEHKNFVLALTLTFCFQDMVLCFCLLQQHCCFDLLLNSNDKAIQRTTTYENRVEVNGKNLHVFKPKYEC